MKNYNLRLADRLIHRASLKYPSPNKEEQVDMLKKAKIMIDNEIATINLCAAKRAEPVLTEGEKVLLQKTFEILEKKK